MAMSEKEAQAWSREFQAMHEKLTLTLDIIGHRATSRETGEYVARMLVLETMIESVLDSECTLEDTRDRYKVYAETFPGTASGFLATMRS